jgi:hypothetical protein
LKRELGLKERYIIATKMIHPVSPFIDMVLLKSGVDERSPDVTKGLATQWEHINMVLRYRRTQLRHKATGNTL